MAMFGTVFLLLLLAVTRFEATTAIPAGIEDSDGYVPRRSHATDDGHGHGNDTEDSHGQDGHTEENTCTISKMGLVIAFNNVAIELNVTGLDGAVCSLPVEECHDEDHHDNEDDHDDEVEDHHDNEDHESDSGSTTDSQCLSIYKICEDLILHTNLTSASCLSGECHEEDNHTSSSSSQGPSSGEVYGYGFLMVLLVSLVSLLGIIVLPLLKNNNSEEDKESTAPLLNNEDKQSWRNLVYKYTYSFFIALGTSALLCDAILHLLPHAWDLHDHSEDDPHGHGAHGVGVEDFIWKGTIVVIGVYIFFLLEFMLHSFTSRTHSHGLPTDVSTECQDDDGDCVQLLPHSQSSDTTESGSILHPATTGFTDGDLEQNTSKPVVQNDKHLDSPDVGIKHAGNKAFWCFKKMKPLAWLILIGDGTHNFVDGLALGVAISQSLTLGVSTTIAILFHEIPHEFGDYVILLSTGLSWYVALLFNFLSALTAVLGFFVGAAIGTESEEANGWILSGAAGFFIYIALVDLLPELVYSKEKGSHRWGLFLAANIGFYLSFLALFLLAVYEEDLNGLIDG